MNHGLCKAGISVWSWISGLAMFIMVKTVAKRAEKNKIHLYRQRRNVASPQMLMKKAYHNLVSPMVRSGGRCRPAHNPIMKAA